MKKIFPSLVIALSLFHSATGQSFDTLVELKNHAAKVYCSPGNEPRANTIATRVDNASMYYQQLLGFKPDVILLVLTAADWSTYTSFPVYGMPHYNDDKTLIVAAEDNPFWKSFLPPLEQLPPDFREQIQTVYKNEKSQVSMQAFFDLLALHELGHAFQFQGGLNMQRKWMSELYTNILLHAYLAENEPESLPALTLFPRMVIAGGTKEFTYTSLQDLEARYNEIGQQHPKNYGWYQSRWHAAAGSIYDAGGKKVGRQLWDGFKREKKMLTDEQLIAFLLTITDKSVADMMTNWDRETIK